MRRRLNSFLLNRILGGGLKRRSNEQYIPRPEDFIPAPPKPKNAFNEWPKPGMGHIGFIFLALMIPALLHGESSSRLGASGEMVFKQQEYWRLFTALFAHADILHLSHNALTFLFFSWILRGYFGNLAFPLLSVLLGIISNLVTINFYEPKTNLIGASGMIYGMVALWLVLYINFDRNSTLPQRVVRSLGFSLLILFPQSYEPRTSYLAHGVGFLSGLLGGVIVIPLMRQTAPVVINQAAMDASSEKSNDNKLIH